MYKKESTIQNEISNQDERRTHMEDKENSIKSTILFKARYKTLPKQTKWTIGVNYILQIVVEVNQYSIWFIVNWTHHEREGRGRGDNNIRGPEPL